MSTVFALAKVFGQQRYAEQFVGGVLHMQSLRYFREYRDESGAVRGDDWEGCAAVFQTSAVDEICFGPAAIPGAALPEQLTLIADHPNTRIFCAYALHSHHLREVSRETLQELKSLLSLHEEVSGFGAVVALVINPQRFFGRVDRAIAARGRGYRSLMSYFDERVHHGYFQRPSGFMKRQRYANQREYRISLELPEPFEGPLSLDVGDLSDIVVLTTVERFNEQLSLRLPDGSSA